MRSLRFYHGATLLRLTGFPMYMPPIGLSPPQKRNKKKPRQYLSHRGFNCTFPLFVRCQLVTSIVPAIVRIIPVGLRLQLVTIESCSARTCSCSDQRTLLTADQSAQKSTGGCTDTDVDQVTMLAVKAAVVLFDRAAYALAAVVCKARCLSVGR